MALWEICQMFESFSRATVLRIGEQVAKLSTQFILVTFSPAYKQFIFNVVGVASWEYF